MRSMAIFRSRFSASAVVMSLRSSSSWKSSHQGTFAIEASAAASSRHFSGVTTGGRE
jgi:hypothetical protein